MHSFAIFITSIVIIFIIQPESAAAKAADSRTPGVEAERKAAERAPSLPL